MKTKSTKIQFFTTTIALTLLSFLLTLPIFAAGEVDSTFNTNVGKFERETVTAISLQADGKILAGGNFTLANGLPRTGIVRFNADGSLDTTFNAISLLAPSEVNVRVDAITVQPDGKILIAGNFQTVNGVTRPVLARLNADGSLDNSFVLGSSTTTFPTGTINQVVVQPDGKVIAGGIFNIQTIVNGQTITRSNLVRYNADGSYDQTFNFNPPGTVLDIVLQSDGKIVIGGAFGSVARLNPDGSIDSSFTNLTVAGFGGVTALALQPDGKIVAVGSFTSVGGFTQGRITRLNQNGTLDTTFNVGNPGANNAIYDVALAPDGKIVIVGVFTSYNNVARNQIARLNADGSLDTTFNAGTFPLTPNDVLVQPDGKIIASGFNQSSPFEFGAVVRLNADGSRDTTFAASLALISPAGVADIFVQADGKILVGGNFTLVGNTPRTFLARLNADGTVDPAFVPNVNIGTGVGGVFTVAAQADGKVIVGGELGSDVQRLNADGSRDTSFNPPISSQGTVNAVAVQADGKILVGGTFSSGANNTGFVRLNADGTLDASFNVTASGVLDIFVQPDGKILIGGGFTIVNGAARGRVARVNSDGTLDLTFNPPFGANGQVNAVVQQADGKILIGGTFSAVNGVNQNVLARFNADGSLDASFTPSPNGLINSIVVQADSRILVGGNFSTISGFVRNRYARLLPSGAVDTSFNSSGGAFGSVSDIALLPDGKILIGGAFTLVGGQPHIGLARILNASKALYDFDGDGRSDISVFRPSNGFWYQLRSQNNGFFAQQFGQSGDQIAPADYDGDGKTDIAVFRTNIPGAGNFAYFYIYNSSNNSFRPEQFGATGDVPVSGDWDGDGIGDLAVYRDGSLTGGQSSFYYRPSSQPGVSFRQIAWGAAGDKPLVGDFDGDSKLDAAVFRPSMATWYILRSSNNTVIQTTFGLSTDVPVPADYDGDGTANIAVFRPSTGTWFTSTNPANNYGAIQFGANGDVPVPADYDGDGRADVAVFRPSNGAWYLNRSTQGFTGVSFGAAEDKPIPNAFIR